jgi:uncharacterized protein (DUF58 family)
LQEKVFEPTEQEKVLFIVDVDQFAKEKARQEFERTLEVIASLAVRFTRQNCAVGLLTNGVMTRGGPHLIPVSRNGRQLNAILEALARLEMERGQDLMDILRRWPMLPWGISSLCFAFEGDEKTALMEHHLRYRKIPVALCLWRFSALGGKDRDGSTYHIEDMYVKEAGVEGTQSI